MYKLTWTAKIKALRVLNAAQGKPVTLSVERAGSITRIIARSILASEILFTSRYPLTPAELQQRVAVL